MVTLKSSSRAWRAIASATCPPPATIEMRAANHGLDQQILRLAQRNQPRRAMRQLREAGRRRLGVERIGPERPAATARGVDEHPAGKRQVATPTFEQGDDRHRRPAIRGGDQVVQRQFRRPARRASSARSARIHIVPPHTRPVFQARSSLRSYARNDRPPCANDVACGQDRVGLDTAAAERARRASALLVIHRDELGADHLRRAALRSDHGGDRSGTA